MTTTTDMMRVHILLSGWRFGVTSRDEPAIWTPERGMCVSVRAARRRYGRKIKWVWVAASSPLPYNHAEPTFIPFQHIRAFYQYVCTLGAS